MSRIDNKYIEALGNFTDALGEIVELLKEQQKKGTEDVVNNFAQTPMGDLSKVVDDLKTIKQTTTKGFKDIKEQNNIILKKIESLKQQKEAGSFDRIEDPKNKNKIVDDLKTIKQTTTKGFKNIKEQNNIILKKIESLKQQKKAGSFEDPKNKNKIVDDLKTIKQTTTKGFKDIKEQNNIILKKIESLKQQKEAGSFDRIEDPKNKNKIVDGIKVVTLIAGGVLAMGMAFKLIGKVDFLSVIALSGSIFIMSKTFSQLMEFKNLKYPDVLKIASILPIMSFAILASAFLISKIPKISFSQGLSMIFVGGSLGVATWLLLKAIKNVEMKDFGKVFLFPFVLPTISLALFLSAFFIQKFPIVGFIQGLSLLFVGASLGITTSMLLKSVKDIDLKEDFGKIFLLPLILPTISLALFLSAYIIQNFPVVGFKQGLSLLFVGATLGASAWILLKAIKGIDLKKEWKTIFALPFVLPTIALALYLSAFILQKFPNIGFKQGLSILFVGATLGVATWVLLKTIKNVNIEKEWKTIFALPFVLPTISLALYLSAVILQKFPIIGFRQGLSILFVGTTLGIATWVLLKAIKNVNIEKDWKTIAALPFVLPLIAYALTLSSSILQDFEPLKKPMDFLISTALIGISVLIFSPVIKIIGKMEFKDILKGAVSIPLIALAIVGAAYVFRELPTDMKYPGYMWSLCVGLSILVFAPMLWLVGKFGLDKMIDGMIALPLISLSIVLTAKIFNLLPNEMKYPAPKWTLGTGLSILVFAPMLWLVGKFGLDKMIDGMIALPLISLSIVLTAKIFNLLPNEMKYPAPKWTLGTGLSLLAFGGLAAAIGAIPIIAAGLIIGLPAILLISLTIVAVSNILSAGKYEKYPSLKWSTSVGLSLLTFSLASVAALAAGASNLIGKLFTGGTDPLVALAQRMVNVANKLNEVDWASAKHPTKDYAEGVGGLLESFANVFSTISKIEGKNKFLSKFGGGGSTDFIGFVKNASEAMLYARDKLSGDWTSVGYPTKDYAEGVGGLLESFANVFSTISKIEGKNKFLSKFGGGGSTDFIGFVGTASDAMVSMRDKLAGDWTKVGYPDKDYAEGVGGFLESLANSFASISKVKRGQTQGFSDFVYEAANAMVIAKNELDKVDWINNENYPKKEYSEGIGAFLLSMGDAYSKINSGGFFKFLSGNKQSLLDFVKEASNAIVESSKILANGVYTTIIDKTYIESFSYFITEMGNISKKFNKIKSNPNLLDYSKNLSEILSKNSLILANGKYENIPSKEYMSNFSNFILSMSSLIQKNKFGNATNFVNFIDSIKNSIINLTSIPDINESLINNMRKIKDALEILSDSVNLFLYEKGRIGRKKKRDMTDFSNFSNGLLNIVTSLKILSELTPMPDGIIIGYQNFLTEFGKLPELSYLDPKIESINKLANSFATLANSLKIVNDNLEGFTNLSKGLFLISIIDDKKFDNVLQSIDKHKNSLKVINQVPKEQDNLLSTIKGLYETASNKPETTVDDNKVVVDDKSLDINKKQQFYDDVAYIRSILENIKDEMAKPSQQSSPWV